MAAERRPCCCCMTSRTGTLIFGWLDAMAHLLTGGFIIVALIHVWSDPANESRMRDLLSGDQFNNGELVQEVASQTNKVVLGIIAFVYFCVLLPSAFCLLYGAEKGRKTFLMPYMILSVFHILGYIAFLIGSAAGVPLILLGCLLLAYLIWKLSVVWCHYLNLSDKERQADSNVVVTCTPYHVTSLPHVVDIPYEKI